MASAAKTGVRRVFVTVGTTKFDMLIEAVDDPAVASALAARGYTHLIMQIGSALYQPHRLFPAGQPSNVLENGLNVQYFDFAPSLAAHMAEADLIISHAGSGCIFESLSLGKALIAVPNPLLMDNHQVELAEHLSLLNYTFASNPSSLASVIRQIDPKVLKKYPKGDPSGITEGIDRVTASLQ